MAAIRRIGILAPPINVAMETELPSYVPPNVKLNHNRLTKPGTAIAKEAQLAMANSLDRAASDLAQANPEVIVYGCTSASFLEGLGNEAKLADRITMLTGIPAVTTSTAVIEALKAVRATRVFMLTPYPDLINKEEALFLQHYGFGVEAVDSFFCADGRQILTISSADVASKVLSSREVISRCDAVFVSCTNLLVMDQIDRLERELNLPVVTSNQASLWAALRRMKIDVTSTGVGRLFKERRPQEAPVFELSNA
ncbi:MULTISPECIES: maleate cis-trans isomerase family protein [Bradyrhizobium]|uniref:Maleate cis-trans isomerase n=3 Tax=Bradyrhizobium TaxID=374 RepID=A0AAE6CC67_9BRAD|nr:MULTISPECIES: aspartate/glutamate racemase family protein [Bradyrhizobium]MCG2629334.1 aspartate/glutamate racemase family protein [Bradyrhizobium zhengyangense]MCG2644615.1 aspartate/glutamate racemase family protein [Bradyrhizobium zhengyangense]MCG2670848.1 aspartate/glutamate racemase family protein [Bradyrhizobium zhengyangense]MDN4984481.1 aspartate/glutamate racemase family protein [Bradyrhizobium sp. WYCCWR 13022]MDN5002473.1 aspartate/glutamate racemase family protein [Bradyrhizobi